MKNLKIIIVVFTLIMGLMGCDKEEESSTIAESKIYFRWTEDLNTAVCPTIVANGYSDNNNDVPDNAAKNNYYGPCKAGTY